MDSSGIRTHEDADLFREALSYTAGKTGFLATLVEKDYFCSVLLAALSGCESLVFKGGTCLTKVYLGFYRLSEDLDFMVSAPIDASRTARASLMRPVKAFVSNALASTDCFRMLQPLYGANDCSQYAGAVSYRSLLTGREETIKLEVSLREPLLLPPVLADAATILLSPVSGESAVAPVGVTCISALESLSEKFRAALSRREVAIRDFYDICQSLSQMHCDVEDSDLVGLVRQKLAVCGITSVILTDARLAHLRLQLDARLKPVLRASDFNRFDLEEAWEMVVCMADAVLGAR